jgi:predicted nucleic acid-binding protein
VAALLDASVLIAAERGRLDLAAAPRGAADAALDLALAAITASELLHGVHRLKPGGSKVRAEAYVEALLARIPVIPFDLLCARAHARLGADLARRGITVGAHDLLVAATALSRGWDVVTRDRRSFPKIPDLVVRVW